ncbi:MAG: nuclear transport factor 2 family protein [Gemmatimonadota bacterium]
MITAACATAPVPPPGGTAQVPTSAEGAAVIRAAEALFTAMEARDTTALRRLFMPEAQLAVVRRGGAGEVVIQTRTVGDFVGSIGRGSELLLERMWSPSVQVEGDLATLWAPYDFHQGERFSHCGIDAFQFVRTGGEWRIVALTYTIQTESCAPPPGTP